MKKTSIVLIIILLVTIAGIKAYDLSKTIDQFNVDLEANTIDEYKTMQYIKENYLYTKSLEERIDKLENKADILKTELCIKDPTYKFC